MGLLKVHIDMELKRPELVDLTLNWLKRECNASVKMLEPLFDETQYWIEGEDIPEGKKNFYVDVCLLTKGVYMLTIKQ